MNNIVFKHKSKPHTFEERNKNGKSFYDGIAKMPSITKGNKTDPISIGRLARELGLDK